MVSNQKPTNNTGKDKNNPKTDLEKEIDEVLNACRDIVIINSTFIRDKENVGSKPAVKSSVTKSPVKPVSKNASQITLEQVAQDMTHILKDLKDHIPAFKTGKDSFSDVVPKIEQSFLKISKNEGFLKTCKNKSPPAQKNAQKPANNSNNTKPKANPQGGGNKTKTNSPQNKPAVKSAPTNNVRKVPQRTVYDPLGIIKDEVQKAIRDRKTFTIKGVFPAVRRALVNRGWIEKLHISYRDRLHEDLKKYQTYTVQELVDLMRIKDIAETCKKIIKSKLLVDNQVDLYWGYNFDAFKECPDKIKLTKINKFRRDVFSYTSKVGLCDANKKSIWFKIPGISNFNHPRTYSLSKDGDIPQFIKDFNRTAAMSLLKWVVQSSKTGECKILSPSGKVPIEVFDFAINECYKVLKRAQHQDIDNDIKEALDYEWNEFLEYFYKTVHIGNHFKSNKETSESDMVRKASYILDRLSNCWPYLQMDGIMNMWMLKPTNGSQGVGIHICRTLQYILNTIKANPNRRYIIQKYIERPLLIHKTKFDIRQWFLISSSAPLTIWMYKRCYLRFSSQTYNLRKLHESIHLTNNSVQSRYPKNNRDIALPSYNMWDSTEFKNYLSNIGYPDAFDKIIYPEMKQCIVAAVLIHQEKLDRRKNCFELYGADFMLTEDFKPWLLEINSNPALSSSTPITAKMCPAVLEDVIKVVVDYDRNKSANTGGFELAYKKDLPRTAVTKNLQVQGKPLKTDYFYTPSITRSSLSSLKKSSSYNLPRTSKIDAIDYVKNIGSGMRKTLEDLLTILKKEKQKRRERKSKGVVTILSHIITETKESQTEYVDHNRILSETLIKSQILETHDSEMLRTDEMKYGELNLLKTSSSLRNKKSGSKHNANELSCNDTQLTKIKSDMCQQPQKHNMGSNTIVINSNYKEIEHIKSSDKNNTIEATDQKLEQLDNIKGEEIIPNENNTLNDFLLLNNTTEDNELENTTEDNKLENTTEDNKWENTTEENKLEDTTEENKLENTTEDYKLENTTEENKLEDTTEDNKLENTTSAKNSDHILTSQKAQSNFMIPSNKSRQFEQCSTKNDFKEPSNTTLSQPLNAAKVDTNVQKKKFLNFLLRATKNHNKHQ